MLTHTDSVIVSIWGYYTSDQGGMISSAFLLLFFFFFVAMKLELCWQGLKSYIILLEMEIFERRPNFF